MANIFDVAKYILSNTGEISTMKLQKLCYYSQAWHLVWENVPLFKEEFKAWANGPVCSELFAVHKGRFSIDVENIPNVNLTGDISAESKSVINRVIETFGQFSGAELSYMTHKETPWLSARDGDNGSKNISRIVSKKTIKDFYTSVYESRAKKTKK